jgi:hypothetical protein
MTPEPIDAAVYWHEQFLHALSGHDAGYAGAVHERLTHPTITFRSPYHIDFPEADR